MAYAGRYYPIAVANAELLKQCNANQIAIFGDSRVVTGILPTAMNMPVANLALPGASPVETYFQVQKLLKCPERPRLVIIAHSAAMYPADKFFWSVFAGLGILNEEEIRQATRDASALGDSELQHAEHPSGMPYGLLPELYTMRFPPLYFGNLLGGYIAVRWHYNERALKQALASKGRSPLGTAAGSTDLADEAKMNDWRVSPLVDLYLNRTLNLLKEQNVPVMLITMPVNDATCAEMPKAMQPRFSEYLSQTASKYSNVDYVNPNIPCWPNKYYGDAWHFNDSGAAHYTQTLQTSIISVLQQKNHAPPNTLLASETASAKNQHANESERVQ